MNNKSVARTAGIWKGILQNLQGRMTKGTFDSVFAGSQGELVGESQLIVYAPGQVAFEWMSNRWAETIKEVAQFALDRYIDVAIQLPAAEPEPPADPLEISGDYHTLREEIIQPDRVFVGTQYFREKWVPLLGPTLAWLILHLRQRCYYGKGKDDRQRNTFITTYKEIGEAIGVNERTVQRLLAKSEDGAFQNLYVDRFIKCITPLREQDHNGRYRTHGSRFVIYLSEPLTPEDERLAADHRTDNLSLR